MDSEQSAFYIKSADNAGMPQPLRIFDYSERKSEQIPAQQPEQNFVTHTEFEEKLEEIKSMIKTTAKEKKSNGKSSV